MTKLGIIKYLTRKRHIIYDDVLTIDTPGIPVIKVDTYEAFKLQIKRRDTDPEIGEVNFLLRDPSNNLRFLLVYCFMEEPNCIVSISYWINNKVQLPSGELVHAGVLIDNEKAVYFVIDFIERYLKKHYKFVLENLQQ